MHPFETTIYHAVIITVVLLAGLFLFLIMVIRRSQRQHFKLHQSLFIAELSVLEKERTRIAHDLHDELGSFLSVIILQIAEAERHHTNAIPLLQQAQRNIATANQRLAEIARNLTPQSLVSKGLDFALQEFLGQFEVVSKLTIEYKYEVNTNFGEHNSLQIFRMIQEIVNNTIKHAEASVIIVHLRERKKKLYLLCSDNGKGFAAASPAIQQGLGLKSLRNRAELLGGKMHFTSLHGTEYFFEMPLLITEHEKDDTTGDS